MAEETANEAVVEIEGPETATSTSVTTSERNVGGDNMSANAVSSEDVSYVEPMPDPYDKAIKYLEHHNILQLFQTMTTNIVYKRPDNPVDFMIEEIEELKKSRGTST